MSELIQVSGREIGDNSVQTVNARDLHDFLDVRKDFSTWIKDRIEQFGFVEHRDYVPSLLPNFGEKGQGRPSKEYAITLDMAKHLAMVERNDKGKQARQYFIECERRVIAPAGADLMHALNDPATMRGLLLSYTEKVMALGRQVDELVPKAQALDRISASEDAVTITQAAKLLGIKRETLTAHLVARRWVYRHNGALVAYEKHIQNGQLQFKEARYTDRHTGKPQHKPYCHILPRGLTLLAKELNTQQSEGPTCQRRA